MAIMVALMLVVMMAAVALAVDAGGLYLRRRELVNGADAAALSAARTCARGTGNDPRFATPEEAADYQAQGNAPILPQEVAGPNITSIVGCGQQYGHVSVQYTSQQALYFAPALGFDHQSPVTTAATASWGLGSNNPVPMVLSDLFKPGACSMPPNGKPSIGAVCAFWYDNDSLGGGNFTFLSLDAHGWDVTPTSSCNQAGGTNQLTDWITGADPASVTLNWTDPTYVCSDGGIKGVGNNPNSLLWSSVLGIKGQTRDFPINWEGPGAPVAGAVPQGSIFKTNGDLDKYDIIGFAAMTILDVVTPNNAQGSTGTCALTFTNAQTVQDLASCIPAGSSYTSVKFQPGKFSCGSLVGTVCTVSPVPKTTETATATVTYTTYGSCGPPPANNSAVCIVLQWEGSTLTDDYQPNKDNITVVRLCDPVYATCLDQ